MAKVLETTTARKPSKSFYATLYDAHGILGKVDGTIYFFDYADSSITEYEPEMAPWCCILGEAGIADTQALMDKLHGGAAWIATHRLQEVA